MKRILRIMVVGLLLIASPCTMALAQNPRFGKYANAEGVDYVCITHTMLELMGNRKMNVNGMQLNIILNDISTILVINSDKEEYCRQMKEDFEMLKADNAYEPLLTTRTDGKTASSLYKGKGKEHEFVLLNTATQGEATFVVLTGSFNASTIKMLLSE